MKPETTEKRGIGRTWRWLVLLLSVLAIEALAAAILHRSDEALRAVVEQGSGTDQVAALFVLTNRGASPEPDEMTLTSVLQSSNPLVREWCLTTNPSRFLSKETINTLLARPTDRRKTSIRRFFWVYQIGKRRSLSLSAFEEFLEASSAWDE